MRKWWRGSRTTFSRPAPPREGPRPDPPPPPPEAPPQRHVIVIEGRQLEPGEEFSLPVDTRDAIIAQEAINGLYVTLDRQQRTQFSRALEAVVAAQERRRTGAGMIAHERLHQIYEEHFDAGHDDEHVRGELLQAALCYAGASRYGAVPGRPPHGWPWEAERWTARSNDPVRNLVKAGALIAAEIDRLLRQKGSNEQTEVHL